MASYPFPTTDRGGITTYLTALVGAGFVLRYVDDGGEYVRASTVHEAVEAVLTVDDAVVSVKGPSGRHHWLRFVMGNEPFEVLCDHGDHPEITPLLDEIMDAWDLALLG